MPMTDFMDALMTQVGTMMVALQAAQEQITQFMAYVTYQNNGGGETYATTYGAYTVYSNNGGTDSYATTLDNYHTYAVGGGMLNYSTWVVTMA